MAVAQLVAKGGLIRALHGPATPALRCPRNPARLSSAPSSRRLPARVVSCDVSNPNFFIELIASTTAGTAAGAVTVVTSEDRDKNIEAITNVDTEALLPLLAPVGAAIAVDTVAHSIPVLNVLLSLLSEPAGAAAGVAYLMTLVLSSPSVDPKTLAPAGTVLNAEKAEDIRGAVRVPFTQIIPLALKVVDFSNEFSSGKGWTVDKDGLPRLPVTSVLIVIGVGTLVVELLAHAPVLGLAVPRVLQVAGWLAVLGAVIDEAKLFKK